MARILTLEEAQKLPPGQLRDWAYNALDTTGPREIHDILRPRLGPKREITYTFERGLQGPSLSMMLRGVRVNHQLRASMVTQLKRELAKEVKAIQAAPQLETWDLVELETGFCPAEMGKHHLWPRGEPDETRKCKRCGASRQKPAVFNPNSPDQVKHLFYDLLGVEEQTNKEGDVSTDDDALGRIAAEYPEHKDFVLHLRQVRDYKKQLGTLGAKLSSDMRYHSTFSNTAWTGRFSSSQAPNHEGGNLQNVAERHRAVFIADNGMEMGYADYMQGESNIVAHLSGDERYLEAHRLGDVHTYVTRFMFPHLSWTGDLAKDKKIAKQNPPWDQAPGHDYRFQTKRIVHGGNYGLTPRGIIMLYPDIPYQEAKAGWENYMTEFDGIPAWQDWVAREIKEHRPLVNPLGRTILLMGRATDKHTIRQGLSFLPQSLLADIENIALWRVWYYLEQEQVQLLAQVHDAILHQFPQGRYDLERKVLQMMKIPVPVTDIHGKTRIMTIGVEGTTGRNWGKKTEANPYGQDGHNIEEYLHANPLN